MNITIGTSGQDYSTVSGAIAVAGILDTLELQTDVTESIYIGTNFAKLYSLNDSKITSTNNSALLQFGTGVTQLIAVEDIFLDKASGNNLVVSCYGLGTGGKLKFDNVDVRSSPGNNKNIMVFDNTFSTDGIILNRCNVHGENSNIQDCIWLGGTTNVNAFLITNCIIRGSGTGHAGVHSGDDTTVSILRLYNNTIVNNDMGLEIACTSDTQNNIFANNTDDLVLTDDADKSDFSYNSFEEQTDTGGFGSNNNFGITSSNEFIDESSNDYHLKSGAVSRNDGNTLAIITEDFDGISRPQESYYCIGAYEYIPGAGGTESVMIMT